MKWKLNANEVVANEMWWKCEKRKEKGLDWKSLAISFHLFYISSFLCWIFCISPISFQQQQMEKKKEDEKLQNKNKNKQGLS